MVARAEVDKESGCIGSQVAKMDAGSIRAATRDDLDELEGVLRADVNSAWTREALQSEIDLVWSHVDILVTRETQTEPAGVAGVVVYWHVADELQLLYIATHPDHLRRGVGRCLLAHLQGRARALGAARIVLEVRVTNHAALALYAAMDFGIVGKRREYYRSGEDALLMAWAQRS
jgi:ribosomal-protein-alanine N-acetyltransferase